MSKTGDLSRSRAYIHAIMIFMIYISTSLYQKCSDVVSFEVKRQLSNALDVYFKRVRRFAHLKRAIAIWVHVKNRCLSIGQE